VSLPRSHQTKIYRVTHVRYRVTVSAMLYGNLLRGKSEEAHSFRVISSGRLRILFAYLAHTGAWVKWRPREIGKVVVKMAAKIQLGRSAEITPTFRVLF
jgi:hypothetical protein